MPGPQNPICPLNLFQLEDSARAIALVPCALHINIALVFLQRALARFGTFRHSRSESTTQLWTKPVWLKPASNCSELMQLNEKQKKHLRGLAHGRDPIVMIGQSGASEAVTKELDIALGAHELVKVKARVGDRDERDQILQQLAQQTSSELVQRIGNVGVFYRASKDKPRIILPD
jgi:RNA-binding protein